MSYERYQQTIETLFNFLELANQADSSTRDPWQVRWDATSQGWFGKLKDALVEIAGEKIFDHWAETGDVEIDLASRFPCQCLSCQEKKSRFEGV